MNKPLIVWLVSLGILFGCQAPSPSPISRPATVVPTNTTGQITLQAGNQQEILLREGQLTIYRDNQELGKTSVQNNRFTLPVFKQTGPYTYKGEGLIEKVVPIGGSQGGIVPIGGSQGGIVPIGGSQGGFHLQQTPAFAAGQTIAFEGQIQEDLTQALPQLQLTVKESQIRIVSNVISNNNSPVNNSIQTNIGGDTQGNVTIVNGTQPTTVKLIKTIQIEPSGPIRPDQTLALQAELNQPDNGVTFSWKCEQGVLNTTRGQKVSWTAQGTRASVVKITLTATDTKGRQDQAEVNVVVQNS